AELQRPLLLCRVEVDRPNLRRAGDARALYDREADRAAADDGDARSLRDLRDLEHGHDAGRDGAAEQARLLERQLVGPPHRGDGGNDGACRVRPGSEHGREAGAVGPGEPAGGGGRLLAPSRQAPCASLASAACCVPAENHPIADGEPSDVRADRFDRSRALVPEQDRQRMSPAVLLDHVEVGVTDAAGLDSNSRFAGSRLVDDDLLERDRARCAQDDAAIHEESSSLTERAPSNASVRSVSAASCWISAATPSSPPTASAYTYGRPRSTAFAPSAIAFTTSAPPRMPPSMRTVASGPTAVRTSSSASSAATAPST